MVVSVSEQKDLLEKGYIHCSTIIEILGAPKDHVVDTLYSYVQKIKNNKDITVLKEEFSKPKKEGKLFSMFVELEIMAKNASTLAYFCFDYMPSSIEIIEPSTFRYSSVDFSGFFNDLQARLHKVDQIAKELAAKNKNLLRNTNMLLRNNVILVLDADGALSLPALAKRVGLPDQQLLSFVKEMIHEQWLEEKDGAYSLAQKSINPFPLVHTAVQQSVDAKKSGKLEKAEEAH
ncbi:hypothetical protein HYU19_05405 [Candidatus Woesearchaeota archaeon]|nr:hypothetical protein [Candidatus Woesearchaeota archaeon]